MLNILALTVLGLLIGSFLNATAGRWGTSRQNARRSKCWQCGLVLTWRQLVPLVSWLYQQGRCDKCFGNISFRYPLVELATAVLFVAGYLVTNSITELVFILTIFSLMIIIALIDIDQFIIPHELSVPLIALSFASLFISPLTLQVTSPDAWQLLAGPILAAFFWGLWLLTRGQGMGFADGTLALSIGWLLGISHGVFAAILSFWIGLLFSLVIILYSKLTTGNSSLGMKSQVPFGPYLVAGYLITFLSGFSLFDQLLF